MKRVEERRATCLYVLVPALALERAALLSCTGRQGRQKQNPGWEVASSFELPRDGVIIAQPVDQRYAAWIGPDLALWWDESNL
jgi:hypothetical protein